MRACCREIVSPSVLLAPALQRKRLLPKHCLDDHITGQFGIDSVFGEQVLTIGNDDVSVLHELQFFKSVVLVQAHALTENLQHVDDAEGPVALMRAKFTMVRVIHCDQRVDTGLSRRL